MTIYNRTNTMAITYNIVTQITTFSMTIYDALFVTQLSSQRWEELTSGKLKVRIGSNPLKYTVASITFETELQSKGRFPVGVWCLLNITKSTMC